MTTTSDANLDQRLIQSSLAGDDEAFAELVGRHRSRIFGIAARFARHHQELDDVAQEIFIKVYQNLDKFRAEAPFEHWLSRIAVRCCYDLLRRTRRERAQVSLDHLGDHGGEPGIEDNTRPARAREVLEFAMNQLAPEDQLVITLLELQEYSVREIAESTGWSESKVKVRAHRARQRLKTILETTHER